MSTRRLKVNYEEGKWEFLGLLRRYIVLKAHPLSILRSDIKTMIREYNWEHELYSEKVYPFTEGSQVLTLILE